ncbi:MAG: cupin-like domain-containing protein [Bacteriovorax sp.]|nr:cupin-like domain-containing protein [Bacteriovorax sp.]
MNEFVYLKKPVIITDGLDLWKAKDWNLEILKEKIGKKEFGFRTEEGMQSAIFSEMIDRVISADSSSEISAPYLRNMNLIKMFPELKDDVSPNLLYMKNNWRDHWMWPKSWPEHVSKDLIELFISAKGVAFPKLHIDYWGMDGLIAQLHGSKEFILYPSEDSPYLYPSPDNPLVSTISDFNNPDFNKFPELVNATQYRFQLNAGEILYNPRWWHTTLTLENSITVIMAYWNRENYPVFIDEIKHAYKNSNKLKTFAKINYFKGLGFLLENFE